MTLPNPGVPLSLSQIKGEFGGPANSYGLATYYAGGTYVPTGTKGYYGNIPVSPNTIAIKDFYGAPVSAPAPNYVIIAKDTPGPSTTKAGVIISNNGFMYAYATKTNTGTGKFLSLNGTQYTNNLMNIMLTPSWIITSLGIASSGWSFRAYWTQALGTSPPVASTGTGSGCTTVAPVNSGNWTNMLCSRSVILTSSNTDNDGLLTLQFAVNTNLSNILNTFTFSLAALSAL